MDGAVEVQVARRFGARVRPDGITADEVHEVRAPDLALLDRLSNLDKRPIESPLEPDLELHAGRVHRRDRPVGRRQVPVYRLLAKDVLAGRRRRLDHVPVRVSRRAHQDRIDRVVGD